VRKARRSQLAQLQSELDEVRPYLDLAREIQHEVARVADDSSSHVDTLAEVIEQFPQRERLRVVRAVFDKLPPQRQWEVIERAYGDEVIRELLEAERAARVEQARRSGEGRALAGRIRAENRLDTRDVLPHRMLTLGLFRETDVQAAVARGHMSDTCARRLVLRATDEPGVFGVMEDVFNPRGGYFVTALYDEQTWRTNDRFGGHTLVRAGAISTNAFEPVLYPGGRVDFETGGRVREGRLHLGFATLDDYDLFVG
jgi:hypothetical protein